ncbi:DUF4190 domain-containing protein [Streptomyces sp. NPDC049555]|uniref:DUF4190 domain-containing protein n=1 Tax=Streptomyces sp. NPDC049555 TaxID=3154930 RepID=UPI003431D6FE
MSDKDDAQHDQPGPNPWAPPEPGRVPLEKPAARPTPTVVEPAPGPAAAAPAPAAPSAPAPPVVPPQAAAPGGAVPPVPPAPTGPGTPSAYPGGPYAFAPGAVPQGAPYGQTAYGTGAYGYPAPGYPQGWPAPPPVPNNGLGTAGMVLGIVGTILAPSVVFSVILGVLAVVFGAIGRGKARTGEATNGGQALTGLILGPVAIVASVLMLLLYIYSNATSNDYNDNEDPDDATYGAYMPAPPGPAPLVAARR